MAKEIVCQDKFGNEIPISTEDLEWRISVCGILRSPSGAILFARDRTTMEWELPGGGIELEETVSDALKREFEEETAIKVEVESIIGFTQNYYFHRGDQRCYKTLRLCFLVSTLQNLDTLPEYLRFISPDGYQEFPVKSISLELIRQFSQ
jgi:8-oxo-dGTP pyrophosphatase MutT (NUDIX family)